MSITFKLVNYYICNYYRGKLTLKVTGVRMYAELDTLGKRVKYFREQKKLSHINYKSN